MCISPNLLRDGTLVGCRECWQCNERRVLDWSGRCIAESKTSSASHSITLTYGRGLSGKNFGCVSHERAHVLTYSDVQNYFKRVRKAGFPCRYFVAGEYGGTKGRSHWHVIIFWLKGVPPHELRKSQYMQPHWHHGFSFWDTVGPGSVRYVCKYIQKDLADAERQGHLSMSKKPPLGAAYFADRAQRFVDARLSPQNLFYSFPEAVDADGKKLKFMLGGRSAELFMTEYLTRWREQVGGHYPPSDLLDEFEDKLVRDRKLTADEVNDLILNKPRKAPKWESVDEPLTLRDRTFDPQRLSTFNGYVNLMQQEFQAE